MLNLQIGQKTADWVAIIEAAASFAWPAAFVIAVILLRKEVRVVLPRLRSIKGWGIDAQLDHIDSEVSRIPPSVTPEVAEAPAEAKEAVRLEFELPAQISLSPEPSPSSPPIETIIRSWAQFERSTMLGARVLALRINQEVPTRISRAVRFLKSRGIIDPSMMDAIGSLQELRNEVVHGGQVSLGVDQADRFRGSVEVIEETIRQRIKVMLLGMTSVEREAEKSLRQSDTPGDKQL